MGKYYKPEQLPQAAPDTVEPSESMADFAKKEREATLPRVQKNRELGERELRARYGDTEVDRAKDYRQV